MLNVLVLWNFLIVLFVMIIGMGVLVVVMWVLVVSCGLGFMVMICLMVIR